LFFLFAVDLLITQGGLQESSTYPRTCKKAQWAHEHWMNNHPENAVKDIVYNNNKSKNTNMAFRATIRWEKLD
jgi:hypothetical protein